MKIQTDTTKVLIFSFCVFILFIFAYLTGFGLRFNASESLPHTLYFSTAVGELELGQVVDFKLTYSQVTFAKIIAGVPGDIIHVKEGKVFINDSEIGKIIEPFKPISAGTIPEEYFFVMGTHPESFDSRYEMFGLVHRDVIREKLCPIF